MSLSHLTDKEFKSLPPEVRRSCGECGYLKSAISWWCGNPIAIEARGTSIPGICNCPYWKTNQQNINMTYLKFYWLNTKALLLFSIALIAFLLYLSDPIAICFVYIIIALNLFVLLGRYVEFKREKI